LGCLAHRESQEAAAHLLDSVDGSVEIKHMSQLASFTYMKAADAPFLGFWSRPKPRLFRKPEYKFTGFLHQHALRESVFDDTDGVHVGLVLAWIESQDERFSRSSSRFGHRSPRTG